ncbi:SHOCT domain-containing protein [Dethiobacter alkaliphilus]|uniref:SHOCT domain-containing protein n=1 Tax=Dethiobacter alkaliphilus AHT 1 TaxID=555088 RepID=C0GG75_DETAL|nr:SHOCT domain-containing protein [Dethiobacter alkaliphilus]EEG77764.1 conserved hypothetical protein [Dethiobacter alkaliphilus AHT 1]MCW3491122.1 SHOCT domain-containing protein [Dethiobacter alkaliphilus]
MMWYGHGMWFGGILMMLFWIVLIAAIVYFVVKALSGNDKRSDKSLEILDERYSKGEIDDEEYLRRKKNLLKSK